MLKSHVGFLLYTFLSYYASNIGQIAFFSNMFCTIFQQFEGLVVCGGNSKLSLDLNLDKSKPLGAQLRCPTRVSLPIAKLLHSLGLIDI